MQHLTSLHFFFLTASALAFSSCHALKDDFHAELADLSRDQPAAADRPVTEADIAHLPLPVQKYLRLTKSIGKPRIQNFRARFDTEMFQKPGSAPIPAPVEQISFLDRPARLFFMTAAMYGLPVQVYHSYREERASMRVRVASVFNAVDLEGGDLSTAETVTFMNDVCILAPAGLVDRRFSWKAVDARSALAAFKNGPHTVNAQLYFNEAGELVNFVSEDRYALQEDGTLRKARWSTPLRGYRDFDGRRAASEGEAVWHYPEGDFVYGKFFIREILYNVPLQ